VSSGKLDSTDLFT